MKYIIFLNVVLIGMLFLCHMVEVGVNETYENINH